MSYTIMPDPHPGRCLNFRHDTSPYGKARRCLNYEGKPHVCEFDPPEPSNVTVQGSYTSVKPQPWMRP